MNIVRNITLIVLAVVAAHFTAIYFGLLYDSLISIDRPLSSIGSISTYAVDHYLIGIIPSYIFIVSTLFLGFGTGKKYWWIGGALLPAAAFVVYFDLSHFWFYILIAFAGWLIGLGVSKILSLIKKQTA